ncbi:hypothetical protein [Flavobacterium sp.]
MKKLFYYLTFSILSLFLFSCSANLQELNGKSSTKISENKKINIQEKYNQYLIKNRDSLNLNQSISYRTLIDTVQYDFNNTMLVENINSDVYAITAKELNNNENAYNTKVFLLKSNNSLYSTITLRTIKEGENVKIAEFYNENNELALTATYDQENISLSFFGSEIVLAKQGCGDAVAACVSDEYSNHGWDSVALGVISAFFPEAIIAVTILCIKKKCK